MWRILSAVVLVGVGICLTGCGAQLQTTEAGIPRKVVVRKNHTPLFTSGSLDQPKYAAKQWAALFVYEETPLYYAVGGSTGTEPQDLVYVRRDDVYEWNSRFCLNFTTSPDQTNRAPIKFYETLEGAQRGDGAVAMVEKDSHRTDFAASIDPQPILKDHGDNTYWIAGLHDDVDEQGNFIFLGNFKFAYVRYDKSAQQTRRYVSRTEFDQQITQVLNASYESHDNMNPDEVERVYGDLKGLVSDWGEQQADGAKEVASALKEIMPEQMRQGIFEDSAIEGRNTADLSAQLHEMNRKMVDYLKQDENWNEHGYGYVPVEWIPDMP